MRGSGRRARALDSSLNGSSGPQPHRVQPGAEKPLCYAIIGSPGGISGL